MWTHPSLCFIQSSQSVPIALRTKKRSFKCFNSGCFELLQFFLCHPFFLPLLEANPCHALFNSSSFPDSPKPGREQSGCCVRFPSLLVFSLGCWISWQETVKENGKGTRSCSRSSHLAAHFCLERKTRKMVPVIGKQLAGFASMRGSERSAADPACRGGGGGGGFSSRWNQGTSCPAMSP